MIFNLHINQISQSLLNYFKDVQSISRNDIQIQKTRKDFKGDWTLIIFPLLKYSNKSMEDLASNLGVYFQDNIQEIVSFNVVKGFLNLEFSDKFWLDVLKFSFSQNFEINSKTGKTILVEFSSPNTNKPLHLGHLRNILLGNAMSNILIADGNSVKRVQIINDRGIHICKSMLAWRKYGNQETPLSSKIKGDYLVGKYYILFEKKYKEEQAILIAEGYSAEEAVLKSGLLNEAKKMLRDWESGNQEVIDLWQRMNSWVYEGFRETYNRIGVSFDKDYYESETYLLGKKCVKNGVEKGVLFTKDDASIWVDLKEYSLDQKLLLRSDGTAVYMTQDLGTAIERYNDFSFNQMIYVVGNEQNYHFEVLFKVLKKMQYPWSSSLQHLSYGMVNLPDGKMKSREGTVIDIDDLFIDMHTIAKDIITSTNKIDYNDIESLSKVVGDAALKYFILKTDAKKNMLFDPESSIDFNGHTGPFIQYTYARIQSIIRKCSNFSRCFNPNRSLLLGEKNIIKFILEYPVVINNSAINLNPSFLANYLYFLAKEYNHFYQTIRILNLEDENDMNFRVTISEKVSILLFHGMNLLGISVPEKM